MPPWCVARAIPARPRKNYNAVFSAADESNPHAWPPSVRPQRLRRQAAARIIALVGCACESRNIGGRMNREVQLYVGEELGRYGFPDGHPFGPDRQDAFWREADKQGLPKCVELREPRQAT